MAALSGVLLWCSFFPLNWGWCAWFALVPLLALVRMQTSMRSALLAAWLGGLIHYGASLQWVRVAHPMMYLAWIGLTLYCALYFPIAIWCLRRLDRVAPLSMSLPVVWITLEYVRAHLLTGFAWYFLGHTQHDLLPLIQVADLAGVYAVTLVVAAVNGLLFELLACVPAASRLLHLPARSVRRPQLARQAVFAVLLLAATLGYGIWRLGQQTFVDGPRVAILQCNLDQETRIARNDDGASGESASERMLRQMAELTETARNLTPLPDLMVWPETTCPYDWVEVDASLNAPTERLVDLATDRKKMVAAFARESRTNVLIGMNGRTYVAEERSSRYNTALLVTQDGHATGRYDKIHCVPFGEYVPVRETFPWMKVFTPYDHDYSLTPGENRTRFVLTTPARTFLFGMLICYEDSDPLLARSYNRGDGEQPAVDFLINISNDGWFDGTEEHEQHLAISRFRAIEARRSLVRSVNMGISGVIDSNGRIVALPGPTWGQSKKVASAFPAVVPVDQRPSYYADLGDWLPRGCAGLVVLGMFGAWRGKRSMKQEEKG